MADPTQPRATQYDRRGAIRIGRALASPAGVLVTLPLLVVGVGVGILLVGRDATRSATHSMARYQLAEQAKSVQADVAFALDLAEPLMTLVAVLADRERPAALPSGEVQVIMAARSADRPIAVTDDRASSAEVAGPAVNTKLDVRR